MAKIPNGHEIINVFESLYPKHLAYPDDKIGLLIGKLNGACERVLVTLDVTEEVVDEAITNDVQLIIAHHPLIFRPLKNIRTDQPQGRIIEKLIKHDIALYAAHTNVDIAENGVNDWLAEAMELQNVRFLKETYEEKLLKMVVYVPKTHSDIVFKAMCQAGAGHIGDYSHCTFQTEGTGTFLPLEGTNPFIGSENELEKVEETKVETVLYKSQLKAVLKAMLQSHPYEEVAYDIYELQNEGKKFGIGRIGELSQPMTLQQFAQSLKEKLNVEGLRVVGNFNTTVKKVAVVGGDGNKFIYDAKMSGADVYVTGDLYFHVAHDAMMLGLNVVDPGHHIEKVFKQGVTVAMKSQCEKRNYDVTFIPSTLSTEPFQFM